MSPQDQDDWADWSPVRDLGIPLGLALLVIVLAALLDPALLSA